MKDTIKEYVFDPENPEKNYRLAQEYDRIGQSASAISYYLRASERTDDLDLAYECLLRVGILFDRQNRRPQTAEVMIKHAINVRPDRPEAYFYLSKFCRYFQRWTDGYLYANLAFHFADFDKPSLRGDVDYPGMYGLLMEKALNGWWTGRPDECRELLNHVRDHHLFELNDYYYETLQNSLIAYSNSCGLVPYDPMKYSQLRYKFKGAKDIPKNYSEAFQDMFVLSMTNGKRRGTYLEIGSADPFYGSNTYLLETKYKWRGVGIEFSKKLVEKYRKHRKNPVLHQDALKVDYRPALNQLEKNGVIDYLQLDCEPAKTTYDIMMKIPFNDYKFRVITYEHDHYIDLERVYRQKSRDYLSSMGYELVVADVAPDGRRSFEDWWVHPDLVDRSLIEKMKDLSDQPKDIKEYFYTNKRQLEKDKYAIIRKQCKCMWCHQVKWPYLQKLDENSYWFEIPKNACTAVKNHFKLEPVPKEKYNELKDIVPIVIVRDPIERFVSNLDNYFNGKEKRTF